MFPRKLNVLLTTSSPFVNLILYIFWKPCSNRGRIGRKDVIHAVSMKQRILVKKGKYIPLKNRTRVWKKTKKKKYAIDASYYMLTINVEAITKARASYIRLNGVRTILRFFVLCVLCLRFSCLWSAMGVRTKMKYSNGRWPLAFLPST